MEKQNDNMRERLMARLPKPENLSAYQKETAALLSKHDRALFWEKAASTACYAIAAIMVVLWLFGLTPTQAMRQSFWPMTGTVYFLGALQDLRYRIYQNRVDTLKELKQVQLQILEVQASLQKHAAD